MDSEAMTTCEEPAVIVLGSLESLTEGDNSQISTDNSLNSGAVP